MKGFLKESWQIYEGYKTYLTMNLLGEYTSLGEQHQDERNSILKKYDKMFNNFEKKLMASS